ncbi:MAG: hypothetical protein AAB875_00485 [Patescibacteria group bacterium]
MTGTTSYSAADLQYVIGEVWGPMVNDAYFAKHVFANHFTDLSELIASQGGDRLHIADIYTNVLTSAAKSAAAEVTLVSPATAEVILAVDTHRHVAFVIEDLEMGSLTKSFSITSKLFAQAGKVVADDLEDALAALWSGLSQSIGDTGTVVEDKEVRQAIEALEDNDTPMEEVAWIFHPTVFWHQVMNVARYYDASQAGWVGKATPVISGNFGEFDRSRGLKGVLYGFPVLTSTNVVGALQTYRNLLAHKDTFIFATLGASRVRLQSEYKLENLGQLFVADSRYGVLENYDTHGVVVNSNTTDIAS